MKATKTKVEQTEYVPYSELVENDKEFKVATKKATSKKKTPAKKAAAKSTAKKAAAKSTAKKVAAKSPAKKTAKKVAKTDITANKEVKITKADIARAIFDEHYGHKSRKEILVMFMEDAGLTKNGASTYLYNFKRELKG